jgi:pyroglutamyl-peptidase
VSGVLVTGFEPFGGSAVNPSQQLVAALDGEVATAVLPVSYARADDALRAAIRAVDPDVVVCFGQAERAAISIERFALNLDGSESADNDGATSAGEIDAAGPVAYRSTLPVDELVAALRADGIPAAASRDAGGFLCNHVFYTLMRELEQSRPRSIGGFVHVPMLPAQALEQVAPSMPLDLLVGAGRVIVAACELRRSSS